MRIDKRRKYYLTVDTETSVNGRVVDFGAVITDKQGRVFTECAVLVNGVYGREDLFYNRASGFFGLKNLEIRKANYETMLQRGDRMIATVPAINKWLARANDTFKPTLTAYNLPFDLDKAAKTEIDLTIFERRFCLWREAARVFGDTKAYRAFLLANKYLTPKLNGQTSAEVMCHFVTGNRVTEPHTALEDVRDFEVPILTRLLRQKKGIHDIPVNWRDYALANIAEARA